MTTTTKMTDTKPRGLLGSSPDVHTFQMFGIHPTSPSEAAARALAHVTSRKLPVLFASAAKLIMDEENNRAYYEAYVTTEGPWEDAR